MGFRESRKNGGLVSKRPPEGLIQTVPLSTHYPPILSHRRDEVPAEVREEGNREGDRPTFHAGIPIPAILESGTLPRRTEFNTGQNVIVATRSWRGKALVPFLHLRGLADYDLVRIAINDVKGQIRSMSWAIKVRERWKPWARDLQSKVNAVRRWVEEPDPLGDRNFEDFVSEILEELLTTDAVTMIPRFDLEGVPLSLEQIDGGTIKPLIDDRGRAPLPPDFAYQQILYGRPETQFRLNEMWYLPMNRRPDTPYGISATEQVILTVNLAMRNQIFDLNYFTHGNLPDSLYAVPEKWNAKQIEAYQEMFDNIIGGQSERRSGALKFVPGGDGAQYIQTKERKFQYEFQEWLARVICWSFGISPIPIAKMVNRASAEMLEESSLESGIRPIAKYVAGIFNRFIWKILESPEVEFEWGTDEIEDPTMVFQRNVAYVQAGIRSIDDVRKDIGDEPLGLNEPYTMAPTGPIFLSELVAERDRRKRLRERGARAAGSTGPMVIPAPAPGPPAPEDIALGPPSAPSGDLVVTGKAAFDELARWRRYEKHGKKRGGRTRQFESFILPPYLVKTIRRQLVEEPNAVTSIFDSAQKVVESNLGKQGDPSPRGQRRAEGDLAALLGGWFDGILPGVVEWAAREMRAAGGDVGKLAKQDEPPVGGLSDLIDDLSAILRDSATAGAVDAAVSVGIDLSTPPETSIAFAQERAAELVGKKILDNGSIIDNPNAQWAITSTIRDDIQRKVVDGIEAGWSTDQLTDELSNLLGGARARMVARTETGRAYGTGAADFYDESKVEYVQILDGAGCLPDGHNEDAPRPSGRPGVMETDRLANGQVWTVSDYRGNLLGHPNCVRGTVAYEPGG